MADAEHPESDLTTHYRTLLAEQIREISGLRERLDDALDSREQAEIRLEEAESFVTKARALATHWGFDSELDQALAQWPTHCRREPLTPPPWDDDRVSQLEAAAQSLGRESKAAREAEFVAIERLKQERLRAEAAEKKCDELRSELRALYLGGYHDRPTPTRRS